MSDATTALGDAPAPAGVVLLSLKRKELVHELAAVRAEKNQRDFSRYCGVCRDLRAAQDLSGSMRPRSSSVPARPYIARFSVFNRSICPPVWPLLHRSLIVLCTASISRRRICANRPIPYRRLACAPSSELSNPMGSRPWSMPRRRIANRCMAGKFGSDTFRLSIFFASSKRVACATR
jgi:hypothetical protein